MNEDAPTGEPSRLTPQSLTEVARSFTMKVNLGNYESADFFCSQKIECYLHEVEAASARVYAFCRSEVFKAVEAFKAKRGIK